MVNVCSIFEVVVHRSFYRTRVFKFLDMSWYCKKFLKELKPISEINYSYHTNADLVESTAQYSVFSLLPSEDKKPEIRGAIGIFLASIHCR